MSLKELLIPGLFFCAFTNLQVAFADDPVSPEDRVWLRIEQNSKLDTVFEGILLGPTKTSHSDKMTGISVAVTQSFKGDASGIVDIWFDTRNNMTADKELMSGFDEKVVFFTKRLDNGALWADSCSMTWWSESESGSLLLKGMDLGTSALFCEISQ